MISRSGIHYDLAGGIPTLKDVCVALCRLPRWCGATRDFWPVAMHSHVVAEMLAPHGVIMELAGLTHDIGEGMGLGDIASPLKSTQNKRAENVLRNRFAKEVLGLDLSVAWNLPMLHECDKAAAIVERQTMFDGKPTIERSVGLDATERVRKRFSYMPAEYLCATGRPAYDLQNRIETLTKLVKSHYAADTLQPLPDDAQRTVSPVALAGAEDGRRGDVVACDPRGAAGHAPEGTGVGRVREGTVYLDSCSACGAVFSSGSLHACHPEGGFYEALRGL